MSIEYFNDKQQAMDWKDDHFYRPAKFSGAEIYSKGHDEVAVNIESSKEKLMEVIEERVSVAFNDGFFVGAGLMVALGLFVWSAWLLFS